MIGPKVTITGSEETLADLRSLGPRVRQAVNRRMITLANEMKEKVQEKVSTFSRSGRLMRSIQSDVQYFSQTIVQGEVYADMNVAPYARLLEEGGSVYGKFIIPRNRRALLFLGATGAEVFSAHADQRTVQKHYPAKRYLRDTMAENRDYIISELRGAAREAL